MSRFWYAVVPLWLAATGAAAAEPAPSAAAGIEMKAIGMAGHGRRAEADPLFRKALALDLRALGSDHPATALDYSASAVNLAAEGKFAEAERLSAAAVSIVRRRRATALSGADGPEAALTQAKALIEHRDPLRPVFKVYLSVAWALGRSRQSEALRSRAFEAAQEMAGSASAMAMSMAAARTAAGSGTIAPMLHEQQTLTTQIVLLDRRLIAEAGTPLSASAKDRALLHRDMLRLAAINGQIDAAFPAYRAIIAPQPLDIATTRAALSPDEALLFLVASGSDIHSFAIGPHGSAWNKAEGAAASTIKAIDRLHCQVDPIYCGFRTELSQPTAFEGRGYRRYDLRTAYDLYARLIAPVAAPLSGVRTVYVVTSGLVGDLPLAMLVTQPPAPHTDDADPKVLADAPWVSDRFAFVHLPAVAGLQLRTVRTPGGGDTASLDGYGDPILTGIATAKRGIVFRSPSSGGPSLADPASLRALPALPGTRRELLAMAQSVGASENVLHLQAQATETEVKHDATLAHAKIVVFATHGILPGEIKDHREAGLILTPPDKATIEDDGILTASEASQLSLKADWVILSACNTASSKGLAGADSLSSLARGFLYAGAEALLASHWRVSDDATAALTVETLTLRHKRPDLSGARALQLAMREIRPGRYDDGRPVTGWQDSWSHPSAWAAFSFIADHDR